jgi:outer membrane protein OmpA-like peptidoglycan-associated protein
VLIRNPDLELVEVQGHTDNRGDRALNMRLSQQRAESVRRWLNQHGVEPDRLTAKGYGPTRPLAPNITQQNRARNRRVQFRIVRRAQLTAAASR